MSPTAVPALGGSPTEVAAHAGPLPAEPTQDAGGPTLGQTGHVAALGDPNTDQFDFEWWLDDRSDVVVQVYVCAPPDKYELSLDENRYWDMGDELWESVYYPMFGEGGLVEGSAGTVRAYFLRESSGLSRLVFPDSAFTVLSPPGVDWSKTTMRTLYTDTVQGGSACDDAARKHHEQPCEGVFADYQCEGKSPAERGDRILLLIDAPIDGNVAGYAKYGGMARVSLKIEGGAYSHDFDRLVAHELGHSLFHLAHTDEQEGASCLRDQKALMRSGARCPLAQMDDEFGVFDLNITCDERQLLGWICDDEPLPNEWHALMEIQEATYVLNFLSAANDLARIASTDDPSALPEACGAVGRAVNSLDGALALMVEYGYVWGERLDDDRFWRGSQFDRDYWIDFVREFDLHDELESEILDDLLDDDFASAEAAWDSFWENYEGAVGTMERVYETWLKCLGQG